MKKDKINFVGNFSDVSFEGMMHIVNKLRNNIKSYNIVLNDSSNSKLINYHAAGFFDAVPSINERIVA